MARRRKNMRMKTAELRVRAWTRFIKKELFPDEQNEAPMAHRINGVLQTRAKDILTSDCDREILNENFPSSGREFVSSGRWTDWWSGKVQPELNKINVIEKIIPGSNRWLKPGYSRFNEHPAHTLFYAIDLWSSVEPRQNEAMELLIAIAKAWAPRCNGKGKHQMQRLGWYLIQFTSKQLIPPELVYPHFRSLEPASILESMLWTGNYFQIHKTKFFQSWLFDLVAAALAADALLLEIGNGQDAVELGGDSGLISAFILNIFIHKMHDSETNQQEIKIKKKIEILMKWSNGSLPNSPEFIEMMWVAVLRFQFELFNLGFNSDSIKELDATFDWIKKRPDND